MIIHSTTLDTEAKVKAIYGGTSWSKLEGVFLLGQSSDYAINSTGGSATHTPSGTVNNHTLTVNQIPSHNHGGKTGELGRSSINVGTWDGNHSGYITLNSSAVYNNSFNGTGNYIDTGHYHTLSAQGGGQAHNHGFTGTSQNTMPPYKTVYIWERTA